MTHLASIVMLLLKIHATRSCAGISLKTQELYALVFMTRYLDLFFSFISVYNTVMKIVFLVTAFTIIWYVDAHSCGCRGSGGARLTLGSATYDKDQDTFRYIFLVGPAFVLALLINHEFVLTEILWTFSIYLEAVAILPQLVLLQRTKNVDNLTGNYVFALGAYRALYLVNWESATFDPVRFRRAFAHSLAVFVLLDWLQERCKPESIATSSTTTSRAGRTTRSCPFLHR
eukprot:scaffold1202_cov384-Prasinococcus_capsulatus_cf.AAC.10